MGLLIALKAEVIRTEIEAMKADNQMRKINGYSPCFGGEAFEKKADELRELVKAVENAMDPFAVPKGPDDKSLKDLDMQIQNLMSMQPIVFSSKPKTLDEILDRMPPIEGLGAPLGDMKDRKCATCRYLKCAGPEEPCVSCGIRLVNWAPAEAEAKSVEKLCRTCKHIESNMNVDVNGPCPSCRIGVDGPTNWEER